MKGMYSPSYYPKDIYLLWRKIERSDSSKVIHSDWASMFKTPVMTADTSDKINLAGEEVSINDLLAIWKHNNKFSLLDGEVHNAAHRFHWVLVKLSDGVNLEYFSLIYKLIDQWISNHSDNISYSEWQPYAISERICNWIVIWQVGKQVCPLDSSFENKLHLAVLNHLNILSNQLEYPASGLINNHVLNNARALYIGGQFVKRKDFSELGKKIILKHSSEMIGEGGFLLEASSHYQLLLTRTYIEIRNVAKQEGDVDFYKWLNELTSKMISAIEFLKPDNLVRFKDYPRIGDVSPDIPFDWFNPAAINQGWQALWRVDKFVSTKESYKKDGWLTLQKIDWSVVTYTHPNYNIYPVGHGHDDFGSFQLYFHGIPVLIDIGRLSYSEENSNQLIGTEPDAHNTILINGQGVLISGHGYKSILSGYSRRNAKCNKVKGADSIIWNRSDKFGHKWERFVELKENETMLLRDIFVLDSLTKVDGYLYFHKDCKLRKINNVSLEVKCNSVIFELQLCGVDEVNIENAPFYPAYGVSMETSRVHWNVFPSSKNFTVETTMNLIDKKFH